MKKIILHLCADTGSDTKPYQDDPDYEVILIGSKIKSKSIKEALMDLVSTDAKIFSSN